LGETQQNHCINYPYGYNPHPNPLPRRGKLYAFTLAEVLITLVIIGVIAAITVPTLMNKTNNQEYVSKLKKAYSTLSQATNSIIAEEGSPKGEDSWAATSESMFNQYKKRLLNARECGTETGCINQGQYKTLYGTPNINLDLHTNDYRLILADGTQVNFAAQSTVCENENAGGTGSNNVCAWIHVDTNGARKPNVIGRDVFVFVLKKNGLYPAGCDSGECPADPGWVCTCRVLREGAMNY